MQLPRNDVVGLAGFRPECGWASKAFYQIRVQGSEEVLKGLELPPALIFAVTIDEVLAAGGR